MHRRGVAVIESGGVTGIEIARAPQTFARHDLMGRQFQMPVSAGLDGDEELRHYADAADETLSAA